LRTNKRKLNYTSLFLCDIDVCSNADKIQLLSGAIRNNWWGHFTEGLRLAKEGVAHALEVLKQFINSRRAEPGLPCVHVNKDYLTIVVYFSRATAYALVTVLI
jgi:hypothetical protein